MNNIDPSGNLMGSCDSGSSAGDAMRAAMSSYEAKKAAENAEQTLAFYIEMAKLGIINAEAVQQAQTEAYIAAMRAQEEAGKKSDSGRRRPHESGNGKLFHNPGNASAVRFRQWNF